MKLRLPRFVIERGSVVFSACAKDFAALLPAERWRRRRRNLCASDGVIGWPWDSIVACGFALRNAARAEQTAPRFLLRRRNVVRAGSWRLLVSLRLLGRAGIAARSRGRCRALPFWDPIANWGVIGGTRRLLIIDEVFPVLQVWVETRVARGWNCWRDVVGSRSNVGFVGNIPEIATRCRSERVVRLAGRPGPLNVVGTGTDRAGRGC